MLSLIAGAAIKTITSYLVGAYMKSHFGSVEIEGAPYWYGREDKDEICVSDVAKGNVTFLDEEKQKVKVKLQKKLSLIIENAIHQNKRFSHLKENEIQFLNSIIKDNKLKWFVDENGYYKNIKVDDEKNMIFVRMCVNKNKFVHYEAKRIKEISKKLTMKKANDAFDELDSETDNF